MNYGEDIAYWYLRLNGFFLLPEFVAHANSRRKTAQIDLLCVRPRYVVEDIGGRAADWDPDLFDLIGGTRQSIGILCEVKTGRRIREQIVFRGSRLHGAVQRLGLLPHASRVALTKSLRRQKHSTIGSVTIAKLLISTAPQPHPTYHNLTLQHAEDFVHRRAVNFVDTKYGDRMLFPWGLFQFAINRAYHERQHRQQEEP